MADAKKDPLPNVPLPSVPCWFTSIPGKDGKSVPVELYIETDGSVCARVSASPDSQ